MAPSIGWNAYSPLPLCRAAQGRCVRVQGVGGPVPLMQDSASLLAFAFPATLAGRFDSDFIGGSQGRDGRRSWAPQNLRQTYGRAWPPRLEPKLHQGCFSARAMVCHWPFFSRKPWKMPPESMYEPRISPAGLITKAMVNTEPGGSIVVKAPWLSRKPWPTPLASV